MSFDAITKFETAVASYFGAPYAVAIDSCTHGVELCLRYTQATSVSIPARTYLSIPFLAPKLSLQLTWREENWQDYYYLTSNVIDAAVLWEEKSYIPGTFMNLSFQYRKHLSLGRGGMILLDNKEAALQLKKMSYDGRLPDIPWRDQNIDTIGYHYYMTPETAQLGLNKLQAAIDTPPIKWSVEDWPDLRTMKIFETTLDVATYAQLKNIDPYLQTK